MKVKKIEIQWGSVLLTFIVRGLLHVFSAIKSVLNGILYIIMHSEGKGISSRIAKGPVPLGL